MSKPDAHLEEFWDLYFKQSIINFNHAMKANVLITDWSTNLNYLQTQTKYNIIDKEISHCIILYGWELMKYKSRYYYDLLVTNIKRWNDLSEYKITDDQKLLAHLKIYGYFLDKPDLENIDTIMKWIEIGDTLKLLDYAFENKLANIIEYIRKLPNITKYIKKNYNGAERITSDTKGNKLIKMVGSKTNL
jgi:hypothetical protein